MLAINERHRDKFQIGSEAIELNCRQGDALWRKSEHGSDTFTPERL
jgi:hypothetical protein